VGNLLSGVARGETARGFPLRYLGSLPGRIDPAVDSCGGLNSLRTFRQLRAFESVSGLPLLLAPRVIYWPELVRLNVNQCIWGVT